MKLFLSGALMVGLSFSLVCPAMQPEDVARVAADAADYVAQQLPQVIPASTYANLFNGSGSTFLWGAGALGAAEIVRRTVSRVLANRTRRLELAQRDRLELAQRDREFMEGNQAAEAAQLTEIAQRIQVNNGRTRVRRNRRPAPQAAPAVAKPAAAKPAAPKLLAQEAQAIVRAKPAPVVKKPAAQVLQEAQPLPGIRLEVVPAPQAPAQPLVVRPLPKPAALAAPKQVIPQPVAQPAPLLVVVPKPAAKPAAVVHRIDPVLTGISQAIDAAIIDGRHNDLRGFLERLNRDDYRTVLSMRNERGNTPMHTIVSQNDEEALIAILDFAPDAETIDYLTISDEVTNVAGRTMMQKANDEGRFDFLTFITAQRRIFQRV